MKINKDIKMIHTHTDDCLEIDIMDLGDDGDGYKAYELKICKVTGESWI